MSQPGSPKSTSQSTLEASVSQLSLHSNHSATAEDWDQSIREEHDHEPSTPPNGTQHLDNEATPSEKFGTRGKKSLSEMLRRHVEKGRSLNLSDEDEENLSEELGKWINSDSSPYELDDDNVPPGKNDSTHSRSGSSVEKSQDISPEPSTATA